MRRRRLAALALLSTFASVPGCGGSETDASPAAGAGGSDAGTSGGAGSGQAGKGDAGKASASTGGQSGGGGSPAGAAGISGVAGAAAGVGGTAGSAGLAGAAGTAGSAGTGTGGLSATATCAPKGPACSGVGISDGPVGTFRKDAYLPAYDETTPAPKDGGRFHVVARAAAGGDVTKIVLDGVDAATLGTPNPPTTPPFEWVHVWPRTGLAAGDPVWVSFHSRAAKWNGATSIPITVETTGGKAVDATVPIATAKIAITYVTTSDDLAEVLVHVKNTDGVPHTISRVVVDGLDASAGDFACVPKATLAPGETELLRVQTCKPSVPGAARTVRIDLADGPSVVAGLRVAKPIFPIEAWNNSDECAFPKGDAKNFAAYQAAGIDTSYFSPDNCGKCGCDPSEVLAEYTKLPGAYTLATTGISSLPKIADTSPIVAVSTGDESDGTLYEDKAPNTGAPRPFFKAKESLDVWTKYPELLTFNGGKTNENVGTFAGTADIQGMDLYVAACAPYILPFPGFPSVRSAYDYLRNTRENHMPLPTWLYSQGLSPAWGEKQPDPQEIWVQGFSVVVAGAKGFLWFQANQDEATKRPDRWAAMTKVNRLVRGVRKHLREGDLTGLASSTPDVLVEAIRSREAIVVPVVDVKTTGGPDWVSCGLASTTPALLKHWQLAAISPTVQVEVPADFAVVDVFEVGDGSATDAATTTSGRKVSLGNVALSNAKPVRLFVLASSAAVRAEVVAAMK